MTVYGPVVTGEDVENAVIGTLRLWTPAYVAEISAHSGRGRATLPKFRSFTSAAEADAWPEDQLPACVVVSPGLYRQPWKDGNGKYRAQWDVALAAICSGSDRASTLKLLRLYCAALRLTALQNPSLGGFGEGVTWLDESYDDSLGFEDSRTIAMGLVRLAVEVSSVVSSFGGLKQVPTDPDADPGDYGVVATTPLQTQGAI